MGALDHFEWCSTKLARFFFEWVRKKQKTKKNNTVLPMWWLIIAKKSLMRVIEQINVCDGSAVRLSELKRGIKTHHWSPTHTRTHINTHTKFTPKRLKKNQIPKLWTQMKSLSSVKNACAFLRSMFHGLHDNFQCHNVDFDSFSPLCARASSDKQMVAYQNQNALKNFAIAASKFFLKWSRFTLSPSSAHPNSTSK